MFKLVISDDSGKTTIIPLIRDEITIGRKEGNTIRLTERNVSRHHAKIVGEDDSFIIYDTGSLLGTTVKGALLKSESCVVEPDDQITIGDYSISIRTDVGDVPMGQQIDPGETAGIGKVTGHARLVILSEPSPGLEYDLTGELYVIGRSEDANIRIDHQSISRAHARIDFDDGKWTISDLESLSGIRINNRKKDDYILRAGDVIELGMVRFRFVASGEPYEYRSKSQAPVKTSVIPQFASSPRLLYVLGGIAAAAIITLILLLLHDEEKETSLVTPDTVTETAPAVKTEITPEKKPEVATALKPEADIPSFDQLLESGKDKMQVEKWSLAARIFAKALEKEPGNKAASELKKMALIEADAQELFLKAQEAQDDGDWENAYKLHKEISRSSHYYNSEMIMNAVGNLCEKLVAKAENYLKNGNLVKTQDTLIKIDDFDKIPGECRKTRSDTEKKLRRAFIKRASGNKKQTKKQKSSGYGNPYQ